MRIRCLKFIIYFKKNRSKVKKHLDTFHIPSFKNRTLFFLTKENHQCVLCIFTFFHQWTNVFCLTIPNVQITNDDHITIRALKTFPASPCNPPLFPGVYPLFIFKIDVTDLLNLFEFRFKIPSVILKRCLHIDWTLSNIYLKKCY